MIKKIFLLFTGIFIFFLGVLSAQEEIVPQLFSEDPKLYVETYQKVTKFSDEEQQKLVPALTEALVGEDNIKRARAKTVLKQFGFNAKSALPRMLEALPTAGLNTQLDILCIMVSFRTYAKEAIPQLISLLKHPNMNIRYRATQVLGAIGPPSAIAIPELIALYPKEDWVRKKTILDILGIIGSEREDVFNLVENALSEKELQLQLTAIHILGNLDIHQDRAVLTLSKLVEQEKLKIAVILALGNTKHPSALPFLTKFFKESPQNSKMVALDAILVLNQPTPEIVPELSELTKHENFQVQLKAAEVLGHMKIAPEWVVPVLIKSLAVHKNTGENTGHGSGGGKGDGSSGGKGDGSAGGQKKEIFFQQFEALLILGDLGAMAQEAIPVIEKLLAKEDRFLRYYATITLLKIQPTRTDLAAYLIEALTWRNTLDPKYLSEHHYKHGKKSQKKRGTRGSGKGDGSGGGSGGRLHMVEDIAKTVIALIVALNVKEAIPVLEIMKTDPNQKLRQQAISALNTLKK